MRKFTKLMLTLMLLVAGVGANAQDGTKTPIKLTGAKNNPTIEPIAPSTLDDLYAATFTPTADFSNIFQYKPFSVDFSQYDKIVIEFGGDNGVQGNWNINLPDGNFKQIAAGTKKYEIPLEGVKKYDDFTIFNWEGERTPITITECYFFTANDPLKEFKSALSAKITRAKMYNGLAYTDASFAALTSEISIAEAALAASDATESSLTTATTNLQDKIDALAFKDGFEDLTASMFKIWDKADAANATSSGNPECAHNLFISTDLPYGEGSVGYLHYADLTSYDKLYVIATEKRPRIMMNRDINEGQWNQTEAESHLIDNTKEGWSSKYFSNDANVYSVNLTLLVSDKGFAHLNAIKVEGWQVKDVITGMYLYKSPDPLASFKEALTDKINNGKLQNALGKTESSFAALTTAISNAQTALTASDATQESLENAGKAIDSAIAGLKLTAGFAKVTKNMFMIWDGDGAEAKATGVSPAGAYNIGVAGAGVPYGYGSGNVYWNHYADLTPYEKLYACGSKGVRARYLFNRPMDTSNPSGEGTSAYIQKYVDVNESGVAELTLSEVSTKFVHLNTFKAPDGGTFTDFLVYAAKTNVAVGDAGYTTFSSIMNVDLTGVTGYAAKYDGSKIVLTEITAAPAGEGIIVKAAEGNHSLTNIESAAAIDNDLLVSDGSVKGDGSTIFALANGKKGVGFYLVKSGDVIPAGKAYLKDPASARSFIGFGSETTGISEVATKVAADSKYYDLQGRTVAQPAKGLYIVNGKKMLVK